MIVDRKFLPAFYTTPRLSRITAWIGARARFDPGDDACSDPENVKSLRIADFACGTGTLLTTAYRRVGQMHELAGGDSEAMHAEMMAHAIIGCDVLPFAEHLTDIHVCRGASDIYMIDTELGQNSNPDADLYTRPLLRPSRTPPTTWLFFCWPGFSRPRVFLWSQHLRVCTLGLEIGSARATTNPPIPPPTLSTLLPFRITHLRLKAPREIVMIRSGSVQIRSGETHRQFGLSPGRFQC